MWKRKTDSHSSVGGFVDHHRLPTGVHIVVHAKVGCYSVQQHPVVGRHGGELSLLASAGRHRIVQRSEDNSLAVEMIPAMSEAAFSV